MADAKTTQLDELTTIALADIMPVVDDVGGSPTTKKITVENLLKALALLTTADEAIDAAADYIFVFDASASGLRKVLPENLPAAATTWGDITGTLADQTDLQAALDAKAATSHNHSASDITSGTLAHERGGLEVDVSAYDGLLRITGGATSAVPVTAFALTILDDTDAATVRATIGAASSAEVTAATSGYSRRSAVIARVDNTAAPPTEVSGDRYLLDATGSSHANWDGAAANDIVEFDGSAWVATSPVEGWIVYSDGSNTDWLYVDDGSPAWQERTSGGGVAWGGVTGTLADQTDLQAALDAKAATSHNHSASDITSGTLAHERGGLEADVSAYAGVPLIDGGTTSELKYNLTATSAPTVDNDVTEGYTIGSRWIDVSADKEYVCLDSTDGAAVWAETTVEDVGEGTGGCCGGNGSTWTARSATAANSWRSVTYGNGLFVAVSSDGANRVMTSMDGINWTGHSAAEANTWQHVTYGNGLFVAVSNSGTNRVMTSPNGTTWTARSAAEANQWFSVTYGNGLFVAVSSDGANRVMTSPDGTTWTARSAAEANQWYEVSYNNSLFVAVSLDGTNRVMTSPDGITWTARSAAEANNWRTVTYGNGLFVAVSNSGTNRVMTSPDGITWTARSAAEANNWRTVTYGNGQFVAVSFDGTNRVMTSPDGITWTARSAAEANNWQSVTYGNGVFVAVANSGANRVMTSGKQRDRIIL